MTGLFLYSGSTAYLALRLGWPQKIRRPSEQFAPVESPTLGQGARDVTNNQISKADCDAGLTRDRRRHSKAASLQVQAAAIFQHCQRSLQPVSTQASPQHFQIQQANLGGRQSGDQ